ncbi:Reverse transcriptase RNA-dependent DNA polymerase [Trinorchestia longiramus]|nr:Reverse transcriptase RNA-dependent DNA polymerase [Trinorchestia longiramus]
MRVTKIPLRECLDEINEVKSCLSAKYKIKDLCKLSYFLGVSVMQTKNEVFLEQSAYTKALFSRFGMGNANSVATPADVNVDLVTTSDEVEECDRDLYQIDSCVPLSTDEAEYLYVALAGAAQEAIWLTQLFDDLEFKTGGPMVVNKDNQSAICLTQNPKYHGKKKILGKQIQAEEKLENGQNLQDHLKGSVELFKELVIIGDAMEEEERVIILLSSLRERVSTLVTALEANEKIPSWEVVTEGLLNEERRQRGCPGTSDSSEKLLGLNGHKPNAQHFRIFGCIAYARIPKDEREQLDSKNKTCVLLGYGSGTKGYRLYDFNAEKVLLS